MKKKNIIIIAVLLLIVGTGGFYAGMKYQQNQKSRSFGQQFTNQRSNGTGNQTRTRTGGRPIVGEILSLDDKSITVELQDGSSKIVLLPESVTVSKTDSGSKADLKNGVNVGIFGTDNQDGSITAQNVQINPAFRNITSGGGSPR